MNKPPIGTKCQFPKCDDPASIAHTRGHFCVWHSRHNQRAHDAELLSNICNGNDGVVLCGDSVPAQAVGPSLKRDFMYHEVNDKASKADLWMEIATDGARSHALANTNLDWSALSEEAITIQILQIAITSPGTYNALRGALINHKYPLHLDATAQRIRQILITLAKGNTDEPQRDG